ncbi:MAG TPA: PsbP-related protein [Conexibacter sp.]|jgi:hypothetical protein|nr:PsbP-related protein [Conexibacter sp.]
MTRNTVLPLVVALLLGAVLAGCGGSGSSGSTAATGAGSAQSEAAAAATGDIPDNQVFLTYADAASGYAIRYPEGWSRQGAGATVAFTDKDNSIQVRIAQGPPPTAASAASALARLRASQPPLRVTAPAQVVMLPHGRAVKLSYSVVGSPNAVTGRRPLLLVDRYVYAHGGKVATVDLATPKGVDNVDAYRMISRSFAWR